jgi:hypothetical protein
MPFEIATPVACDDPTHKAHEGCIKAPGGFVGEFLVLLALRSLPEGQRGRRERASWRAPSDGAH